jgi:hypothetical protein
MIKRAAALLLCALFVSPSIALAQTSRAGVVTTLEGNVTARRVALPNPVSLKFKDDVFLQDTVTTGEKSLARMLLGGKAVVTVRERSILTITEVPGRSTIDLDSGKFSLAVAREKMRPGEEILIRTPNAVAGVRGTVVVTEVNRQSAQAGGAAPAVLTNFYVLRGTITAQQIDPGTRQPTGTPMQVGTLQSYSQAGNATPRVAPVPPEQVGQITSGLQPTGPKGGSDAGQEQVKSQAIQAAVTLIGALMGKGADGQGALALGPPPGPPPTEPVTMKPPINRFSDVPQDEIQQIAALFQGLTLIVGNVTLTDAPARRFSGSFTSASPAALVGLTDAIVVQVGADTNFIEVLSGAVVSLAGPLLSFINSSLVTQGRLLEIRGGTLKSTTSSALIFLDPSSIFTESAVIVMNGGSVSLAGPLLTDVNGTIRAAQELMRMSNGASLTSTGTGALVQFTGTSVDTTMALSMTGSTMTLAGPLASASHVGDAISSFSTSDGPAMFFLDASSITSSGTGALLSFTATNGDPDGSFLRLVNGSSISLAGPLFSASGGTFTSGLSDSLRAFIAVLDGSSITSTTTSSLIAMSNATIDTQGPLVNVRRSPSTSQPSQISLAGPLFSGTGLTINTTSLGFNSTFGTAGNCCSTFAVEQGAKLSSTSTSALISLSSSTVTISDSQSGASFFLVTDTVAGFPTGELVAPATVSLSGPLLSASHSTIRPLFALLTVARSNFTSSGSGALIDLSSSTVTAGGTDITGATAFGRLLTLISANSPFGTSASAARLTLDGPFLSASNSTLNATQVMAILGGAAFTSTTASPLITLDGTALKLTTVTQGLTTNLGDLVAVGGQGGTTGSRFATMDLSGPLLRVGSGSSLDMTGALAAVFAGGQITESHPTSPFVSITSGTHTIASNSSNALLMLSGRSSATTVEVVDTSGLDTGTSSLTLGTDQPLRRSGSGAYLEAANTTISTQAGLKLDSALLSASAPLLHLKSGATLTSAADALNLTANAKLTATGPLVKLDGGTLNITSGHAIKVLNGSFLNVAGDLFSIMNSGTLTISAGSPLFIAGGSVVKISGAFVNFNNSSGTINATNNICGTPCASQGGITFFTQNGATSANISIANGIKNAGSGSLNFGGTTPAIILDGANSKVVISGN